MAESSASQQGRGTVKVSEGWHTLEDDGTKVYTKTWKPTADAKAKMVFLHGYVHHVDLYSDFFTLLAQRGIEVFAWDQRGSGRSVHIPKNKGDTGSTSDVMAEITSILNTHFPSTIPVCLMGHSVGGTKVFYYACKGPSNVLSQLHGILGESPDFGFAPDAPAKPNFILEKFLRMVRIVAPKMQVDGPLRGEFLSRDPKVGEQYKADELCHDTITLESATAHFDRVRDLREGKVRVQTDVVQAVWVGHGTDEKFTSWEDSEGWIEGCGVGDKEFRKYEGWRHNLHAEPGQDKVAFADDVANWILKRS